MDEDIPFSIEDFAERDEPGGGRIRQRSRRGLLGLIIVVVVLTLLSLGAISRFYTELLWFDEVGFKSFFLTRLSLQFAIVIVGWLFASAFAWINLRIASATQPPYSLSGLGAERGIQEDLRIRYREFVYPYRRWILLAVSVVLGVLVAGGLQRDYVSVILFRNAEQFGIKEPVFGRDAGFYVFKLPLLEQLAVYAWTVLVLTSVLVAVLYYLNGSIDLQAVVGERITRAAKTHLSVLLAGLACLQAYRYWLDRFKLLYSDRGVVTGASATDVKASLPAYNLLIVISLLVAILLVANIFRRGWALPVVSVGIWILVQLLGAGIFPAFYQRFAVQPNEFVREQEYIARNIEFTRYAYGLSGIELARYEPSRDLNFTKVSQTRADSSVRLWDPTVGQDIYNQLQSFRGYYLFTDVDIDRYQLSGEKRAVLISTREIDVDRLPSQTWINRHLQFTHGYGVVISAADTAAPDGRPLFLSEDMPVKLTKELATDDSEVTLTVPQIYYGDKPPGYSYAIVKTTQREFDFPQSGDQEVTVAYQGNGGIPLRNLMTRAAFAMRFGDINLLLSRQLTPESRIIIRSHIRERISAAFPLLVFDADPYPVLVNGRVMWVQDAYTATDRFPYSQKLDAARVDRGPEIVTERLPRNSEFRVIPDTNYVRNSIKVVIDAYDGTITLYVVDPNDPIIRAYQKAFPSLFTPLSDAPAPLKEHFRYPEELFRIQSNMFRVYHVTDPRVFYNQEDKWQVPERSMRNVQSQQRLPLEPYYTILKDPRDNRDYFYIIQPFTPQGRPNLLGFIIANSDPDRYGEIIAYSLPTDRLVDGPEQVMARINQEPRISQELTLLDQRGSRVVFGNLIVLPLAGDLLYVQPVFIQPEDSQLPTLQRVIVVYKDRAIMRECAAAALLDALDRPGQSPTRCPKGAATSTGDVSGEVSVTQPRESLSQQGPTGSAAAPGAGGLSLSQALNNAARAYDEAQAALRQGDLGTYQRKVEEMKQWIEEARSLQAQRSQ